MQEDLLKLVFKDELTDLYNRRFLHTYLKNLSKDGRFSVSMALLMIDIDFFKQVNDNYGHLEGDNLLKQLGEVIKGTVQQGDAAIRYAGDEFTIILPGQSKDDGTDFGERLRAKVSQTDFRRRDPNAAPMKITLSIGVAAAPDDAKAPEQLIEEADKALYFSKRSGRNRVSRARSFAESAIVSRSLFNNFPCPQFVGRQSALAEVTDYIMSVPDGHNVYLSLVGPSGIGKSRFLREIEKSPISPAGRDGLARPDDFLALRVTCTETYKYIPYKTIMTLLKKAEMPLEEGLPGEGYSEQDRRKLFDNITSRLLELSKNRPLVLLIDELQNIDDGSLEVINFFMESEHGRLFIVGSIRDDLIPILSENSASLKDFLTEIGISDRFREVRLEMLDETQTMLMISSILPDRPAMPDFDRKIYQVTQGHPLFIEELIKKFMTKQYIQGTEHGWVINTQQITEADWPANINSLINENIRMMEKDTRQMITQATVIGKEIDLNILAGIGHQTAPEAQEMIDKASRMRIIVPVETDTPDQFTFASARVQEAVYQDIDDQERQDLHREVGEVTEKVYKDNPEMVAGILAHHYDKGGATEKAAQFTQMADNVAKRSFQRDEASAYYEHKQSIVRSRIKEASNPLTSEQMNLMKEIMRGLITASKNMRLYPDGSQIITTATAGMIKLMNDILNKVSAFTLAEAKNELQINTTSVDLKAFGTAGSEFLTIMKQHYIKSCTFRKGVSAQEIETFLRNLDNAPTKPFSLAGYWNKFFDERQITNIGVTQRAFFAVKDQTAGKLAMPTPDKIEINDKTVPVLRDLLRYFTAAIENIRLYPAGSQLTTDAVSYVNKALSNIFRITPVLNLSAVEENLLINGTPINPRVLGSAATSMARLIRNYDVKSILITQSVGQIELEKFFTLLSNMPSDRKVSAVEWEEMLGRQAVTNIRVGAISYSTMDRRGSGYRPSASAASASAMTTAEPIMDAGAGGPARASSPVTAMPGRAVEDDLGKLNRLLKALPERLVNNDDVILVLDKLMENQDHNNFKQLADKFFQNFRGSRPEARAQAFAFYLQIMNKAKEPVRLKMMELGMTFIAEGLSGETDIRAYALLVEAAGRHSLLYLEKADYEALMRILFALVSRHRSTSESSGLTAEMRTKTDEVLNNIVQSPNFRNLFDNLRKDDVALHTLSKQILTTLGPLIAGELVRFLMETEESMPREEVINVLSAIGSDAQPVFLNELNLVVESGDTAHLRRMMEALPLVLNQAPENVWTTAAEIIDHMLQKKGAGRDAAFNAIKRMDKNRALGIMMPLLTGKDKDLSLMAIENLAALGYNEAGNSIIAILDESTDRDVIKECCNALGRFGDERAVPILIRLLKQKRFLGLFGGVADEVRGTCAWALGQFKSTKAQDALKIALNDRSPSVRSAARLGLKDIE